MGGSRASSGRPAAGHRIGRRIGAGLAAITLVGVAASSGPVSGSGGGGEAAAGRFCEGMNIRFFPGGTAGGGFETVVYNGAKAAEEAFGPNVDYQWSDWDPATMISQFQEAVAAKPDGIAIMGHPGDDAFDPLIDDAIARASW